MKVKQLVICGYNASHSTVTMIEVDEFTPIDLIQSITDGECETIEEFYANNPDVGKFVFQADGIICLRGEEEDMVFILDSE